MDNLEANSMLQIPIIRDEEHENSTAIEQTLSLEAKNKPKKMVHQFYFVKYRPYKDPDEASKISEAEQIFEKMNKQYKQMEKLRSLEDRIGSLSRRKSSILYGLETQKKMLDHLKLLLDKLNLACKIPHKHKGGPNHTQGLESWISHGSSNLVIERKLLKEMAKSQHRLNDFVISSSSALRQFFKGCDLGNKALADYAENPNKFNPLILRNAIEEQIQIHKKIALELKIDQREVEPALERLEKELVPMKEESLVFSFREQVKIRKQREAARLCILKLRQTFVEMNGMYDEYVSLMSNARELAKNKDIASLRKLSHNQVEEFMSKWNHPHVKTFRVNYESNILGSLSNRGLSHDGRIKFQNDDDHETFRYIEGGSDIY